jgi:hemoglobin
MGTCRPTLWVTITLAVASLWGCETPPAPPVRDGELALPADYKTWPKFLAAVQRPDARQVREIYMNPDARAATAASGFATGTVFVMENYAAKARVDGTLEIGYDRKLVKGELLRVFVMAKDAGWGADVPESLRNGNWVYAAWLPNGQKAPDDTNDCRTCHLPVADKDFVHRYDEHFASRR